ncbi:EndoU domain-containing protein [Gilliamella sp. ESL0405]|nr:EndoU domain-containing protein [Gilliamella sp. ESL0405]
MAGYYMGSMMTVHGVVGAGITLPRIQKVFGNTKQLIGKTATNAGKGTAVNKPLDKTELELQHGKGNVEQGGGNYKETKDKILDNQATNQKANESSNFGEHVAKEQQINAGKGTNAKISPENQKYVDILSPEAKQHILYGDGPTSGGHMYPGNPGKTTFPKDWSADKIVHEIGDIATSPNTQWYAQSGTGGLYTKAGNPARWAAYEIRDGVRIRVIYEPANGKIITAFPDKAPVPSHYKPIK